MKRDTMTGVLRSSFQRRVLQSPAERKNLGKKGCRAKPYTGPQCPAELCTLSEGMRVSIYVLVEHPYACKLSVEASMCTLCRLRARHYFRIHLSQCMSGEQHWC